MQKAQMIEGLTAELFGLIASINVYRREDEICFEQEREQIMALRKDAFDMPLEQVRQQFQNLRTAFQMKYMIGMRSLRCRVSESCGKSVLTEFHTGSPVMLTHPTHIKSPSDGRGYIRIRGRVINILGDGTIILKPEEMVEPDGNVC